LAAITSLYPGIGRLVRRLRAGDDGALLLRGAGGTFAISVASTGVAFVSNIFLARWMGVGHYGVYAYVLAWVNLLALPATLGYMTSLVRFISAYKSRGEFGYIRGLLRQSNLQVGLAGTLTAVVIFAVTRLLEDSLEPELAATFAISALIVPLLALARIRGAVLRALRRVVVSALINELTRPIVLLMVAAALYFAGDGALSATAAMGANLAGAAVAFAIGTFWLRRSLPAPALRERPLFATREWIAVSLPLLMNGALHLIMKQADVLMLGSLSSTGEAGIYAVTARIGALTAFGLAAVNSIVAPMISEHYTHGDMAGLQRTVTRGAWITAAIAVPTIGFLALFGLPLLGLFGQAFTTGYIPLLILLVGYAANALAGSVGFIMTMTGHHGPAFWILALSTGVNLVLNAALIPPFGMAGAAVATAVAMLLWNLAMLVYVWRHFRINPTITAGGFS
jgi:O-antigen/teichoic acid export membrane protein